MMRDNRQILLVDDEINVLNGYRRHLRKDYQIDIAESGQAALEMMRFKTYAVIVSDMRMPEMDGVTFLEQAQELAPDTVRIMLTGNSDQQTAMLALNRGNIFRFLNKPCQPDDLRAAINAGLDMYWLVTTEKVLLERTLCGSVKITLDLLAAVDPVTFSRSRQIRDKAIEVAKHMKLPRLWEMELAAQLAHIGAAGIPLEVLQQYWSGQALSEDDAATIAGIPARSAKYLETIPRLERVAEVVKRQADPYGMDDPPPEFARILKVLNDTLRAGGGLFSRRAVETLRQTYDGDVEVYDPKVLRTVLDIFEADDTTVPVFRDLSVSTLLSGYILAQDVVTSAGALIIAAGVTLTPAMIDKLRELNKTKSIGEMVRVQVM